MRKIAAILSAGALFFAACGNEQPSKSEGGEQLKEPVMNSGPEAEQQRATNAVKDSASVHSDTSAMSTPH